MQSSTLNCLVNYKCDKRFDIGSKLIVLFSNTVFFAIIRFQQDRQFF